MINVNVKMSAETEKRFKNYLFDKIMGIRDGLKEIHTTKLPNWRRVYEARPLEAVRTFPFQNASNIVVPVVAIHADTLTARIMAAIFKTKPLWLTKVIGDFGGTAEPLRQAIEDYLGAQAFEPKAYDLYRIYKEWIGVNTVRYGTGVLKAPWIEQYIDVPVPAGDGTGVSDFRRKVIYEGPKPDVISFEDFGIKPSHKTLEEADFKYHCIHMDKFTLQERMYYRIYDVEKVRELLKRPDRSSPHEVQAQREQDAGARTGTGYGYAEWDLYECWVDWRLPVGQEGTRLCKVIATYHLASNTLLRTMYSLYPIEPMVAARLFVRENSFFGYGFAEMLGMFQEEISTQHNQRRDAMTVANSKAWRVDPDSKLHAGYQVFPSAMIPAREGEIEPLAIGEPGPQSIDEERLSLELAERRSGVSPPTQGMGAGVFNKRGVYSSMGTLSLLQEGNTRTDLNVSDVRDAHTKVGRLLSALEAEFGQDERRFRRYGAMAGPLMAALQAIKNEMMELPAQAASASVNREVEKQTDVMLTNIMTRHYGMINQMLTSIMSPMMPPQAKEYTVKAIHAANQLMEAVARHFGIEEPKRVVPDVNLGGPNAGANVGQPRPQGGPGGSPIPVPGGVPEMAGATGIPGIPLLGPGPSSGMF